MKTKDYYKILDILETSTDMEIKSAYRRLARQYHPDIAGASAENLARFKDINEAYDTLSDKKKRYNYDSLRRLYSYVSESQSNTKREDKQETSTCDKKVFNNFWSDFIKAQRQRESASQTLPENGTDITTEVTLSLSEAINGTLKKVNILHTTPCSHCGGRKFVNGGKCNSCNGTGTVSEHKKLTVKIPANIKNGYRIRIAGEGNRGVNGGKNGNLYLLIKIENNSNFKYDGVNVFRTVPITPSEAVLGADIEVPVSTGFVTMRVIPNTKSGQKFRIQGQGLTKNGAIGDLIVTVEIQIPENMSDEEKDLYRKLAKFNTNNIRKSI